MATETTNEGRRQPDMMLGPWMLWMERYFGAARDWIDSDKPWWQVTPFDLIDNMLSGGVKQLNEMIAKDPLLGSIDQIWNANPLREVVPIDWAEITRALPPSGCTPSESPRRPWPRARSCT